MCLSSLAFEAEEKLAEVARQLGEAKAENSELQRRLQSTLMEEEVQKRQLAEAKRLSMRLSQVFIHQADEAFSEMSWVHLSEAGESAVSAVSGISVNTSGPHCFMDDATFKDETGSLVEAKNLRKGSKILAANGSPVAVAATPKQHEAGAASAALWRHID